MAGFGLALGFVLIHENLQNREWCNILDICREKNAVKLYRETVS